MCLNKVVFFYDKSFIDALKGGLMLFLNPCVLGRSECEMFDFQSWIEENMRVLLKYKYRILLKSVECYNHPCLKSLKDIKVNEVKVFDDIVSNRMSQRKIFEGWFIEKMKQNPEDFVSKNK